MQAILKSPFKKIVMKKRKLKSLILLLVLLTSEFGVGFSFGMISLSNDNLQLMTILRAGTVVSLTTNEEIQFDEVQVGNTLDFFVRSNVVVNGSIVIASGAIAEGWVKNITTSCGGHCSKITITAESVQTVDGQRIFVRSIPYIIEKDCCGRRKKRTVTVIPIGTNVSARVLNDVVIQN